MADAKYECSLDEASLKKAMKELNEDPKERLGAVAALREWVEREPWINAPTDTLFLLAFLRSAKFSQLKAREKLGKFMALFGKKGLYGCMSGCDPACDKVLKCVRDGSIYLFPAGYDRQGRKVVVGRFGRMDTSGKTYTYEDYVRSMVPMFHSMIFTDERCQVNGMVMFIDFSGVTIQMMSFMGMENMKSQSESTNNIPVRIKSINYYNTGPVFETIMGFFKPFLSQKLQNRIHVHGQKLVSVYKEIDMEKLPEEYLPDDFKGSCAGGAECIVEQSIKEYLSEPARRAYLSDLYSGKYFADLKQRNKDDVPQASFRKLNVS